MPINRIKMELTKTVSDRRRLFGCWFARRATTYVVVCAFLTLVNACTSPHYWWVIWVVAGWGLNLLLSLIWYLTDCDDQSNYKHH